ncbi:hypothetical protein FVP33_06975 [Lacisediminihabitans profunda]|uniref:TadE family protein n=1 Tax=Lacisediminihabitans profunda TaxID=2594790 RepID=A0A5C8UTQ4_9MICO|nr:hypothetical protein FVP33_06975 [Lacisediminihabitans profunda]
MHEGWTDERGSTSLEFVTAGLLLLLPLVYLVLSVSSIQAGALAVEGASRQAARVFVQAGSAEAGRRQAERAIDVALADYGLDGRSVSVTVACSPRPERCLTRLGTVTVTIDGAVPLPLLPSVLTGSFPLAIPLHASATQQVSRFWGTR